MPHDTGERRDERQTDATGDRQRADDGTGANDAYGPTSWFANTAVRVGLTIIGIALLLFALGQAFGLPLLAAAVEALSSETGRWLVVAFFAILLIGAAQRIAVTG